MIWRALDRHYDAGLLIARVGFGLGFFWYHGWAKLSGGPETWERVGGAMQWVGITFAPVFWGFLAAFAESIGGLMVAAGLLFRPISAMIAFVMTMATAQHMITGQGTPAHAFKNAWLFAGFVLIGPGRYSLDHMIAARREEAAPAAARKTA